MALVWSGVALAGAYAIAVLALLHGETVNAVWFVVAAVSVYAIAYRFYGAFLAAKLFALDAHNVTPAERINDGRDFIPTNRWVVFGHHFAAIAGPGPLIGPTLAAQFGYLPGTLWILVGVVLGGAVQDLCILCGSLRRDGSSLGQMAKDEIGPIGGFAALIGVFFIMIILIAVLALVVVNALRQSPWGTFTVSATIPIAMLMGWYMKVLRPHDVPAWIPAQSSVGRRELPAEGIVQVARPLQVDGDPLRLTENGKAEDAPSLREMRAQGVGRTDRDPDGHGRQHARSDAVV